MAKRRVPAIRFRVFGTPVRIGMSFPLMILALPLLIGGPLGHNPWVLAAWLGLVTVSVLVHEAGHVAALRACGFHPNVALNALGGLTSTDERGTITPWRSIGVSLAGPAAALLLGISVNSALIPINTPEATWFRTASWFVNIWWTAFNLLPIVPLDGGHVSREFVEMASRKRGGTIVALAAATGAIIAAAWWFFGRDYPLLVGGALALMLLTNARFFAFTAKQRRAQDIAIAHEQLTSGDIDGGLRTLMPLIRSQDTWLVGVEAYTTVGWALLHQRRFVDLEQLELGRFHAAHRPLLEGALRWYRGDLTEAIPLVAEALANGRVELPDDYFSCTFGRIGELDLLAAYVSSLPGGAATTVGERMHERVMASSSIAR
ncbi:MAG: hypothetical protein GX868_06270 [Actinobacteria bacterium]|nr:hypothetical protein [Actinomycetota bacterium]